MITRIMGNTQIAINIPVRIIPQLFMSIVGIIVPFIIMFSLKLSISTYCYESGCVICIIIHIIWKKNGNNSKSLFRN